MPRYGWPLTKFRGSQPGPEVLHGLCHGAVPQSDMESMRDAQGKFLEQLLGDRIHLLTEKIQ